jgi:hypothetical protein
MSAAAYDLLGGHIDLPTEFEQAPPYLPKAAPPIYKPKSYVRHDHLRAVSGELSPDGGPDDPSKFSLISAPVTPDLIFPPASFRAIGV